MADIDEYIRELTSWISVCVANMHDCWNEGVITKEEMQRQERYIAGLRYALNKINKKHSG